MSYSTPKNQVTVVSDSVGIQNFNFYTAADNNNRTPSQKRCQFSFGIQNTVSSFYGREKDVAELDRLFNESNIVVVHSLGGYGKTQLACHYAGLKKEEYCGNLVWIDGIMEEYLIKSFRDVALDLHIPNCKDRAIKSVVQEVYNCFDGTRVLFIIDNAQDYRSILEFLPSSLFGLKDVDASVLITSQSTKWGKLPGLPLQGLSLECALQVLSTIISEDKFNSIPQGEWNQLAETFYCIPLGLQIAGGYVRQRLSSSLSNDFSIKRYIARIKEKNLLLDEELAVDSGSTYKKSIYRSLYFTVEKIENYDGEEFKWALNLINVCAHLNPDDIIVDLLLKLPVIGGSIDKLEEALGVLEKYSLIIGKKQNRFNQTMIRVHHLVQIFFRYHQKKSQTITIFYKESLHTVTSVSWNYPQCVHILGDTYNLKMLLESLTGREKEMMEDCKLLHVASYAVLPTVMQLLLQHGADGNTSCTVFGGQGTPLCFLIDNVDNFSENKRRKWKDAVYILLNHKANITDRGFKDRTILHVAAKWKCAALINHILDKKQLDVNVKDKWDSVPLHFVTKREILDETEMSKAKECIQVLVSRKADINARDCNGRSVLHYTAIYGHWPLTEFLIDQFGMDSNMRDQNGYTPLLFTCNRIYLNTEQKLDRAKKTIEVLAKRGALMNARNENGMGILQLVAVKKYLPLMRYLIENYSLNLNIQDCNECVPLHYLAMFYTNSEAKMEEIKEMVHALVQRGANINATNSEGIPILSMASSACNEFLITYLLEEHQADINQRDNEGRSPLFWVVQEKNFFHSNKERKEATINLLISKNGDPSMKDNKGRTILHHCAFKLNSQLLELFIDQYGLNPNAQDNDGFTVLHSIVIDENIYLGMDEALRCVNVLRNRGARVDLVNNENLTPAQLAELSNKSHLIAFLQ